jgi:nucleoid-associated protein YgaU
MYDFTSRYYTLETAIHVGPDGREVPYTRRRFVPPADSLTALTEVVVAQGDRLDLIAARTLGVPEAFWRIADANTTLSAFDLTATPGRRLRVALPQP